jgi:hypothetical protein
VLIGITIALALGNIIAGAAECIPIEYLWDKSIQGGHCFDIVQFYRWGTLPNVVLDFLILLLPLPAVWRLHSSVGVKVGLTATFLTGSM